MSFTCIMLRKRNKRTEICHQVKLTATKEYLVE